MNFLFSSGGNDSVALIQWGYENPNQMGSDPTKVVYNNTGWASPAWGARVKRLKAFAESCGFEFLETQSIGLVNVAKEHQAWPWERDQFCTKELKLIPSLELMDRLDPEKEGRAIVGVRREESANRAQYPRLVAESEMHGGRDCWAPLVTHLVEDRNELLERAGFDVLPHRSEECCPCVNAKRGDLRRLNEYPERIDLIELEEGNMGVGKRSGKPKTFFRPHKHQGAIGIREIMKWANDGKYIKGQHDLEFGSGCDGGFCE